MPKIIPIDRNIPEPSGIVHYPGTLIWPRYYKEAVKAGDYPIDAADPLRLGWLCMTWSRYNEWKYIVEHPAHEPCKESLETLREARKELIEGLEAFLMPVEMADISFADMGVKCR